MNELPFQTPSATSTRSSGRQGAAQEWASLPAAWGEALFERHPHAVLLVDAGGHVQHANAASARWLNVTDPEVTLSSLVAQALPSALDMALRAGQAWTGPLLLNTLDGDTRAVTADIRPSADLEGGDPRVLCVFEPLEGDTSPHGEARFRAAADLAPVMIWMAGRDSRGDWFNKPWCAYTGRPLAALNGRGWLADIHPEDVERCMGIYATSFTERQPFSMDYRLRRHDGQYRWILSNGVPRHADDGSFQGYIGIGVDIHERKELEERLAGHTQTLRQADRRQNDFLAMLSHELRGPLAPITNAASVLRSLEGDNPTLSRLREIIERQVGRMRRLVDDLVDVTRVMQGQVTLVKQPVAVADLVHSAVETSQAKLDAGGHKLHIDMPEHALWVVGDSVRLSQALSQLLTNAAKFTREPGEIALSVSLSGNDTVRIAVQDKGSGIAPEFLPFVFDLFAQQDQPRVRSLGGLGLGLPLARRVAQLHGGDLKAASAGPERGAEFVMSLPLMPAADAAPASDTGATASAAASASATPCRVMLIEENPDTRYLLKLQIELWGNEVLSASDADDALRLAESFQPDIVLCDLGLTGLNGQQLIREMGTRLRIARPLFAALAGHGRYEDEAMAKAAGFDAFLVKPLRPESLGELFKAGANRQG